MTNEPRPYRNSKPCLYCGRWRGDCAYGSFTINGHMTYVCEEHILEVMMAGCGEYHGPLPVEDEALRILRKANNV